MLAGARHRAARLQPARQCEHSRGTPQPYLPAFGQAKRRSVDDGQGDLRGARFTKELTTLVRTQHWNFN